MCVSLSIHTHGYWWRGRFAHHLSLEAGKSTRTKLKHNLSFCSQSLSKRRDRWDPVPEGLGIRAPLLLVVLIYTSFPWVLMLLCSPQVIFTRTARRAHGGAVFEWEVDALPFFSGHLLQPCCYLSRNVWAGRPRGD